tara:strand:+ start:2048 stop:2647 length:600 start_codon:yes stop_codon:yes gene_type:complete
MGRAFSRAPQIFIDLGLKDQAVEVLKVHFLGIGKNDERIFMSDFGQLDATEQKTISGFVASLEGWQQVQFIYFTAKMSGPTSSATDKKGKVLQTGKPGERMPFLKGLAAMADNDTRLKYLNQFNFFSPVGLDRLLYEIKECGADLANIFSGQLKKLKEINWSEKWSDVVKAATKVNAEIDKANTKTLSWLEKLEKKTRR